MSRTSYAPRHDFQGTGGLAAYDFDFKIEALSQLLVVVADNNGNLLHTLRGTDTTVFIDHVLFDEKNGGGTIYLKANLPNLYQMVVLLANDAPTQSFEFKNKFDFTLERIEMALDWVTGPIQRLAYLVNRTVRMNELDQDGDFDPTLPSGMADVMDMIPVFDDGGWAPIADWVPKVDLAAAVTAAANAQLSADDAADSAAAALVSEQNAADSADAALDSETGAAQAATTATTKALECAAIAAGLHGFTLKGAYDNAVTYSPYDVVTYLGESYVQSNSGNCVGQLPSNTTFWTKMVTKGADGATGAAGTGVPVGGTTGQVLKKNSSTNYDSTWGDAAPAFANVVETTDLLTVSEKLKVDGRITLQNDFHNDWWGGSQLGISHDSLASASPNLLIASTDVTVDHDTGSFGILTGSVLGVASSPTGKSTGTLDIMTGNNSASGGFSGYLNFFTGDADNSGNVDIKTGYGNAQSGRINLETGGSGGSRGNIRFRAALIDLGGTPVSFSPAVSGNWGAVVPDDLAEALDILAARKTTGTGGTQVTGTATTTASTITVPAGALGFLLQAADTNTTNMRWKIGGTATASDGNQLQPGRDTGYVPCAANVSIITETGSCEYQIQWVTA